MTTRTTEAKPREQWSGQLGFLLAAIGSAVGLGNIWRFPGVAYDNGGGAFLIPYLVALLTAGIPILLLDYALGHKYRGSAPTAFRRIGKNMEILGWFQVFIAFAITTYYAAIIGWAISYVGFSFDRAWGADPVTFLVADYLQVADPGITFDFVPGVLWPLIAVWVICFVIMLAGVRKGLELANKIFIPLLLVLFLGLVVRALTLDGAVEGLNAFFTPDFSALADAGVWIAAYAQIFFSLSIAFGIMLTYSSYLKRRTNIGGTGFVAAFANSSFELLAGIGVFAALGFMAAAQNTTIDELGGLTGVGLSFMTFPALINEMPGGALFGVLFFGSLVLAGITSLISLLEVAVAAFREKFGLDRTVAVCAVVGPSSIISVLLYSTSNGLNMLDVVDKYVNEIGIVLSAILMTVLLTYVVRKTGVLQRHLETVSSIPVAGWWRVMVGIVTPIMLVVMLSVTAVALITEGYDRDSYPASFENLYGWGSVILIGVLAVAFRFIPWSGRTRVNERSEFDDDPEDGAYAGAHRAGGADHYDHGGDDRRKEV